MKPSLFRSQVFKKETQIEKLNLYPHSRFLILMMTLLGFAFVFSAAFCYFILC
jgi:hypothetical protein